MKRALILTAVLLAGCSSSDGVIDQHTFDCSPGQELSIQLGLDMPGPHAEQNADQLEVLVQVANDSHQDLTVSYIRVEQVSTDSAQYLVDRGYRKFDTTIAEGKEELFKIPVTGRAAGDFSSPDARFSRDLVLSVTVALTNGDSYRCRFSVRAPG